MDDPLVGLAVWQSQEARGGNNKSGKVHKAGRGGSNHQPTSSDSNRLSEEDNLPANKPSEDSRDPSDKCFPCLPSLEPSKGNKVDETGLAEGKLKAESNKDDMMVLSNSPLPHLENFWLLRLFESNLFTMDIAIQYLYNEKDHDVQIYLGKKLFSFDSKDVDFYLLELINMYIHVHSLSPVLSKYLLFRCQNDVVFSLKLAWLLVAFINDSWLPTDELQRASKLLSLIKTEQLRPPLNEITSSSVSDVRHLPDNSPAPSPPPLSHSSDKHHCRSQSASGTVFPSFSMSDLSCNGGNKISIGDLRSGRAFDTGCTCNISFPIAVTPSCYCSAPRLSGQDMFVRSLGHISKRLLKYSQRAFRTNQLYAELSQLNLNLPARVCIPLYPSTHHVLHIPPSEAVVLNSKSKAPYLILVEVANVENTFVSPLTPKHLDKSLKSSGMSPEEAKAFVHSEGPSPSNTRVSSSPNLRCGVCQDNVSLNSLDNISASIAEEEEDKEENEIEKEERSNSSEREDDSPITISVSDIRKRLSQDIQLPRRSFSRDPEDPSASVMKEFWEDKVTRVRSTSPYGHLPNWNLLPAIVKWGDDLRQELVSWQLLEQFKNIWETEKVPVWIRPYTVLVLSSEGGLIEPVCNAVSFHQIKKEFSGCLLTYFKNEFGEANSEEFLTARRNFVESCAAYCLVCYFIQIKDRHNGNILLDAEGHMIHIDFGFILAHSPGKNIGFESSPFKLTQEFVEVMGGPNSDMYQYFKFLMLKGFLASRKHMERIINIVEIMQTGSQLPCFGHGPTTVKQLRERFHLSLTEEQLELLVNGMIETSVSSLTTKLYDGFQYLTNGIL